MAVEVERLITLLEARITGYERELKRATTVANRSAGQIEARFATMNTVLTRSFGAFGVVLAPAALIAYGKHVLDAAGSLGELADQTGVGTTMLQALEYGAGQSGVKVEELHSGLGKLRESMGEAAGGGETAIAAFDALGVKILDASGNLRSEEVVLRDVADGYANAGNKAAAAAALKDLFGKSARKLIPLLKDGAAGLDAWTVKADEAGAILDKGLIDSADRASDAFVAMADSFDKAMGRMLATAARTLQQGASGPFSEAMRLENLVNAKGTELEAAKTVQGRSAPGSQFRRSADYQVGNLQQEYDALVARQQAAREALNRLRNPVEPESEASEAPGASNPESSKVVQARERHAESIRKVTDALQLQIDKQTMSDREQSIANELAKAGADLSTEEAARITEMAGAAYDATKKRADAEKEVDEILKSHDEWLKQDLALTTQRIEARDKISRATAQEVDDNARLITALQESEAEYERVSSLLAILNLYKAAGLEMSPEEVAAAEQLAKTLGEQKTQLDDLKDRYDSMKKLGSDLGMTFSSAFEDAVVSGNSLRDVLNGIVQDIAKIILRLTVTEPIARSLSSAFASFGLGGAGGLTGFWDWATAYGTAGTTSSVGSGVMTSGFTGEADGTSSAHPGWTWVGENGPELMKMRGGEVVYPNDVSRRIAAGVAIPGLASGAYPRTQEGPRIVYQIDNRGADSSAVARLERQLRALNGSIEHRAVAATTNARHRNLRTGR